MQITFFQAVYCNGVETIDNYVRIEKSYNNDVVPRIGESIYNYVWDENVETKIANVYYDYDSNKCDVFLEKRIADLDKDRFLQVANAHGWSSFINY